MRDITLDQVFSIIDAASDEKPWMTALSIARRLGNRTEAKQIEQLLLAHCQDSEDSSQAPIVRYSSLPSRRTLEVLWGAIEKVGLRRMTLLMNHSRSLEIQMKPTCFCLTASATMMQLWLLHRFYFKTACSMARGNPYRTR